MTIFLMILGAALLLAALVMAFVPRAALAVIAAWCALLCFSFTPAGTVGWQGLVFWGVAALLVVGIESLGGSGRPTRLENAYTVGGALAGAIVGMIISSAGLIVGSALGAFFGMLAWCRTPDGRDTVFPSRQFFSALAGVGLPAVVVMSIAALVLGAMLG